MLDGPFELEGSCLSVPLGTGQLIFGPTRQAGVIGQTLITTNEFSQYLHPPTLHPLLTHPPIPCLSTHLCIHSSVPCPSLYPHIHLFMSPHHPLILHPFLHPSHVHLFIRLPIHPLIPCPSLYPHIHLLICLPIILHSFLPPPSVTRPHILPFCHQSSHLFFPIHSPVLPSHPCIPTFSHPPPHAPSALPSTRPPVTRAVFPGTVVTSCLCRSSLLQTILEIWCNLWLGTCSEAPSLSLSERPERSGLCFLSLRVAGLRGLLFLLTAIGSLC